MDNISLHLKRINLDNVKPKLTIQTCLQVFCALFERVKSLRQLFLFPEKHFRSNRFKRLRLIIYLCCLPKSLTISYSESVVCLFL